MGQNLLNAAHVDQKGTAQGRAGQESQRDGAIRVKRDSRGHPAPL